MKKQPTTKELVTILVSGLSMMSFGLWLIWVPFVGLPLIFIGLVFVLLFAVAITTIVYKKVIK